MLTSVYIHGQDPDQRMWTALCGMDCMTNEFERITLSWREAHVTCPECLTARRALITLDEAYALAKEYDEATTYDIIRRANDELYELTDANSQWMYITSENEDLKSHVLEKLGDTIACLNHLGATLGFSANDVAREIQRKFALRFTKD